MRHLVETPRNRTARRPDRSLLRLLARAHRFGDRHRYPESTPNAPTGTGLSKGYRQTGLERHSGKCRAESGTERVSWTRVTMVGATSHRRAMTVRRDRYELRFISKIREVAETEGFEPSIPFWGYAHLANECLQPLGHVSGALSMPHGGAHFKRRFVRRDIRPDVLQWFSSGRRRSPPGKGGRRAPAVGSPDVASRIRAHSNDRNRPSAGKAAGDGGGPAGLRGLVWRWRKVSATSAGARRPSHEGTRGAGGQMRLVELRRTRVGRLRNGGSTPGSARPRSAAQASAISCSGSARVVNPFATWATSSPSP